MTSCTASSRALIALALLAGVSAAPLSAQSASRRAPVVQVAGPEEVQELQLRDGSRLLGRITDAGDPATFEMLSGSSIVVAHENILSLEVVEGRVEEGRFRRRDPSSNRMFFGPTGRTVGQNHGYVAVFEGLFPSVAVGIHDRVTIGGGTLLLGDLSDDHPFWFIPKIQLIDQETLTFSVGALAANAGGSWAGILYGVATVGSDETAATLGMGYGWVGDDLLDIPVFQVGLERRTSDRIKLMTENYFIVENGEFHGLFGGGIRFIGDRLTADLGVGTSSDTFFLVPLVNFVWNW